MAYNILNKAMQNPSQQNFVAFVGREHLLSVAKHLSAFIQDPKSFINFVKPSQFLDSKEYSESQNLRAELIKTFALANFIYEDEEFDDMPFFHEESTDMKIFKDEERKLEGKFSHIEIVPDMEAFDLKLEEKDFISE